MITNDLRLIGEALEEIGLSRAAQAFERVLEALADPVLAGRIAELDLAEFRASSTIPAPPRNQ